MSATSVTAPTARRPRWRAATAAIALTAGTLTGSVSTAAPAHAAPADCRPGHNGFVTTPRYVPEASAKERVRLPGRGVTLELRQGKLHGRWVRWARLLGSLEPTDQFWFDWSRDGGKTWVRCGPFRVGPRQVAAWTPAHPAGPRATWVFRAGGRLVPPNDHTGLTPWRG